MNFNKHSRLEGAHALLSASKHAWINYDDEKIIEYYHRDMATRRGTELHELASRLITHRVRLPRTQQTLNMFVNDAIHYQMATEQILRFSDNAFGTADAISFKKNLLRIHDYKSGVTKAYMHQLEVYMAFFCLEYAHQPQDIDAELRIYQNDDIVKHSPSPEKILTIMGRIITADEIIEKLKNGVL